LTEMPEPKGVVTSVRLPQSTSQAFQRVCELMNIDKTDFIRKCIDKLCDDNRLLLDHSDKVQDYMVELRKSLSNIPTDKIRVKNGNWDTVDDKSVLFVADTLFRTRTVWEAHKNLSDRYGLSSERDRFKDYTGDEYFDVADIGFLMVPRSGGSIRSLLEESTWIDQFEFVRIALILSVREALTKCSLENIVDELLGMEAKQRGRKLRLVVDASAGVRRSGNTLVTPVDFEELPSEGTRRRQRS